MDEGGNRPRKEEGDNETDWKVHLSSVEQEILHVDLLVDDFWDDNNGEVYEDADKGDVSSTYL